MKCENKLLAELLVQAASKPDFDDMLVLAGVAGVIIAVENEDAAEYPNEPWCAALSYEDIEVEQAALSPKLAVRGALMKLVRVFE